MSTPTPSQPPTQPSSASKKPTGHVTTPINRGGPSPAPRSIPSPAHTRKEQSGKTPVNHPTVSSSHGSKTTLGGTPMVQNLSQTGMTVSSNSPNGLMGSFGTPHGLGVDLGSGTPGQMNVPTPMLAAGMMPTMSEIMGSGGKRNEDEERRTKIRKVLKGIGRAKGRISEEGIARIARRVGMNTDIDDEVLRPEEKGREGNRTIAIAGKRAVVIDVTLKEQIPQDVKLTISGNEALQIQTEAASKVLLQDLAAPEGILLRTSLDKFAVNLDRLARTDRLSSDKINCFEAVSGLYVSLNKLYELEKEAAKTLTKMEGAVADKRAEQDVLRKKSGRPGIHVDGKIGLSLDYWSAGPVVIPPKRDESAMDVDKASSSDAPPVEPDTWSLRVDVESSPAGLYPSLRVSDAWLPETFELPPPNSGQGIPWEEPPQTYVNDAPEGADAMSLGGAKLPDLRFVAKLDPPLVVPLQTAMNIMHAVGDNVANLTMYPMYHQAALGLKTQNASKTASADQKVWVPDGDAVTHHYSLDVSKMELGHTLEELPFSHPRQLVELLPTLRQWAYAGSILGEAFGEAAAGKQTETATNGIKELHLNGPTHNNGKTNGDTDAMDLDDLLDDTNPQELDVDMGLSTSPQPTLTLAYADPNGTDVSNVVLQVLPNADLLITDYNGISVKVQEPNEDEKQSGATQEQDEKAKKLEKGLALCGNLGVWVEWMRRETRGSVE